MTVNRAASTVLVPVEALARATLADVAALVAAQQDAAFFVVGGASLSPGAFAAAVAPLTRALAQAGRAGDLTVQLATAEPAALARLRAAGVQAIEWPVAAPTPAAARATTGRTDAFAALAQGLAAAHAAGLHVRLRWTVTRRATPGLADLAALAARAPAGTSLVLVPDLQDDPPLLPEVAQAWPTPGPVRDEAPGDVAARDGGLTLIRSALWPACLPGAHDAIEPVSARQIASYGVALHAVCGGCPRQAEGCAGVPQRLVAALEAAGRPFTGWRQPASARPPAPRETSGSGIPFDPASVELRGLLLHLRDAWRSSLPEPQVPAFRTAVTALGLHVAVSDLVLDVQVGGRLAPAQDGGPRSVLVVVARDSDVAAACLADELANVSRPPPRADEDYAADLADTLAVHRRLGAAYGYPACCVEAFCSAHAEIVHTARATDNAIAVLHAWRRSEAFDPRLDTLGGAAGDRMASPLRHLPCRFDCGASRQLADALVADLRTHNPRWYAALRAHPAQAVVMLADGSFLRLDGTVEPVEAGQRPRTVTAIRGVHARLAATPAGPPALLAALLERAAEWQAVQVTPGVELRIRIDGAWHVVALADSDDPPWARAFPLLLPFAATHP